MNLSLFLYPKEVNEFRPIQTDSRINSSQYVEKFIKNYHFEDG